MNRHVICALDTSDLEEALAITRRMSPHVGAFKVGHALTLAGGLSVIDRLHEAGANRIFLDLKFHDIPNSVALAVREAAKRGVWMLTLHITGGPAMMNAAVEQARAYSEHERPLLVGVSVLTSLDGTTLAQMGVSRSLEDQMVSLSELAMQCDLDGVVCSAAEVGRLRMALGSKGILVTPGIRLAAGDVHDQKRVGEANDALANGADYLVIGRALTSSPDPVAALAGLGLVSA